MNNNNNFVNYISISIGFKLSCIPNRVKTSSFQKQNKGNKEQNKFPSDEQFLNINSAGIVMDFN